MKKLVIITLLTLLSITILSSCQSHGPKCPGMYSEANTLQPAVIETQNIN